VALGHVGIVLGLEVSRLARNNADWYRLRNLCGTSDTLIGDADGIHHSGLF
jgi:DNA invertase Pin-like site-specific DNA recombinase